MGCVLFKTGDISSTTVLIDFVLNDLVHIVSLLMRQRD
jgi:hypothetical protein